MKRTTVYFPQEMKTAIEREAARRGVTEAEVIRSAVASLLGENSGERLLNLPLFTEGFGENLAGRVEELLQGFGED